MASAAQGFRWYHNRRWVQHQIVALLHAGSTCDPNYIQLNLVVYAASFDGLTSTTVGFGGHTGKRVACSLYKVVTSA